MAQSNGVVMVQDNESIDKNKKYTVYKVVINVHGRALFIYRRYDEFYSLYEKLRKAFPDSGLKLPSKRGSLFGSIDSPSIVKKRREALGEFVQRVFSNPQLVDSPEVQQFFNIPQLTEKALNMQREDQDLSDFEMANSAAGREGAAGRTGTLQTDDGMAGSEQYEQFNLGTTEKKSARPSDFEFLKVIGKGSFGKVFVARLKSDRHIYAVKVLHKEQIKKRNEVKHVMAERNVLIKNIQHPFLIHLHYSFQTREKLYFVLDYVNGGELFFHLQRDRTFPEQRAKFYSAEIASALGYLHSRDIIYRDLKPENLLLDRSGHVVLTDFGLCKEGINGRSTTGTFCGTPEYLAPEVLRKEPYDRTVDWWTLGAVLYEMIYGLPPYYSKNTSEMYEAILHKPLVLRPTSSLHARQFLEGLLQKDRRVRLGARDDLEELKHTAFFGSIDFHALNARQISAPYTPAVQDELDTRNIDREFTDMPVPNSVAASAMPNAMSASVADPGAGEFENFTYVRSYGPLEED